MYTIASLKKREKLKYAKITEPEFIMTSLLLSNLYVDVECDSTLTFYPDDYGHQVTFKNDILAFSDTYTGLADISDDKVIFRPLKYDKYANIIISMFEELNIIDTDMLNIINENPKSPKSTFKGFFTYKGQTINRSFSYNAPNIPVLKCLIIAKLILDENDYNTYIQNHHEYVRRLNHGVRTNKRSKTTAS